MARTYYIEKCSENHDTLMGMAENCGNFDWVEDYKQLMYVACAYSKTLEDGHLLRLIEIDRDNRFVIVCNENFILSVYRLYDWQPKDGDPLINIEVSFCAEASFCSMNMKVDENLYKTPSPKEKEKPKATTASRKKLDMGGLKNTKAVGKSQSTTKKAKTVYKTQLDMFA